MNDKHKQLGKGLAALMEETELSLAPHHGGGNSGGGGGGTHNVQKVPTAHLRPGQYQPRSNFDESQMNELVDSIKSKGILQPLIVRPIKGESGLYEIIAGERRWRAAQRADLRHVPVIVRNFTDEESLEIAIIENVQRQDLNPLEKAKGYKRLMDEFHHKQEELAIVLGKSRSEISNSLRILSLPPDIQYHIEIGDITAGHARVIVNAKNPISIAKRIIEKGLSVRQTEDLLKPQDKKKSHHPSKDKNADIVALESELTSFFGLNVKIKYNGKGGILTIAYDTPAQLDHLLIQLNHKKLTKKNVAKPTKKK